MAYSLSFNVRKFDKDGRHNDRNFDLEKAPHIDVSKTKDNIYWNYKAATNKSFLEIEKEFYEENFSKTIEKQNEKNINNRHPERNKTVDDYYADKKTRPEDVLIQIGDKKEHISGEKLWELANIYKEQFEKQYGQYCKILTMALHQDEETPHVHIRRVWVYENEDGLKSANKTAILEEKLQIIRPDPTQKASRNNNSFSIFTDMERAQIKRICKELKISLTKEEEKRPQIQTKEYKALMQNLDKKSAELKEKEEQIIKAEQQIKELNKGLSLAARLINEQAYIKEIEGKAFNSELERYKALLKILDNDIEEKEIRIRDNESNKLDKIEQLEQIKL